MFDRLGIRTTLFALSLLPLGLVIGLSWLVVDTARERAAEATDREANVERVIAMSQLRTTVLAELTAYDAIASGQLGTSASTAAPSIQLIVAQAQNLVDLAVDDLTTLELDPAAQGLADSLVAGLAVERSQFNQGALADDPAASARIAGLQHRAGQLAVPAAEAGLADAGGDALAILMFQDFSEALVIEASHGLLLLLSGERTQASTQTFDRYVSLTDTWLDMVTPGLPRSTAIQLTEIVEESSFAHIREMVAELPLEAEPAPIPLPVAAEVAVLLASDSETIGLIDSELAERVITEARSQRSAATYQERIMIAVVGFVVLGSGGVLLFIGGRLARRLARLSSVAAQVSAGQFDVNPLRDPGTDDIAVLARGMDEMIGTLAVLQNQLAALATSSADDEVFDLELPGPAGASMRSAVSRVRAHTTTLREQADTDALTGVLNRRALERILHTHDTAPTVMLIDLDDFKAINDTFGHAAGDDVLVGVAQRIAGAIRSGDVVARIGGDEFLVATWNQPGVEPISKRLGAAITEPIPTSGGIVHVGASVGTAVPRDGESLDETIRRADTKMYEVKRSRREPTPS